jgi:hypothetical protein
VLISKNTLQQIGIDFVLKKDDGMTSVLIVFHQSYFYPTWPITQASKFGLIHINKKKNYFKKSNDDIMIFFSK